MLAQSQLILVDHDGLQVNEDVFLVMAAVFNQVEAVAQDGRAARSADKLAAIGQNYFCADQSLADKVIRMVNHNRPGTLRLVVEQGSDNARVAGCSFQPWAAVDQGQVDGAEVIHGAFHSVASEVRKPPSSTGKARTRRAVDAAGFPLTRLLSLELPSRP